MYWKWQKLGKQRDGEAWEMYPSQVNAYYNPPANEVCGTYFPCDHVSHVTLQIVFPAGILQPPFFSKDWCVSKCILPNMP
jgi:endothelin-converting enzyme